MAEDALVPAPLRARIEAALPAGTDTSRPGAIDERTLMVAARERVDAVLDLIEQGRGIREAGSGLNAASSELLVADAIVTYAAARAAMSGSFGDAFATLELDRLAQRARAIDEAAA